MSTRETDSRFRLFIEFAKALRIDVFSLFYWCSYAMPLITTIQEVEDKICLNSFNFSAVVCKDIEGSRTQFMMAQTNIYRLSTVFDSWEIFLTHVPEVMITLFVGRWIDQYPQYTRIVLASPCIGSVLYSTIAIYQSLSFSNHYLYMLLPYIPFGLSGGNASCYSGLFTYVSRKSSSKNRVIRFGMLEFTRSLGYAAGYQLSAYILAMNPWTANQLRNYIGVYLVSGGIALSAAVWSVTMLNDLPEKSSPEESPRAKPVGDSESGGKLKLAELFDHNNVIQMFSCFFKKRNHHRHVVIWNLTASSFVVFFFYRGIDAIALQFAQKIYFWSSVQMSQAQAIAKSVQGLTSIIITLVMVKKFRIDDTTIAIIGCSATILEGIIFGGFLVSAAFYMSQVCESLGKLSYMAFRSLISKSIDSNEIGQILTLTSCLELITPIPAHAFYSQMFNHTIDSYPGFVLHLVSGFVFYPLLVSIWRNWATRKLERELNAARGKDNKV